MNAKGASPKETRVNITMKAMDVQLQSTFISEGVYGNMSVLSLRLTPIWLEDDDLKSLPREVLEAHKRGDTVGSLSAGST